jgi:hypothetical protein
VRSINGCSDNFLTSGEKWFSYDQRYSLALECTERSLDRYLEDEHLRSEIELNKAFTEFVMREVKVKITGLW